jgi:hypothetical protein
MLQYKIFVVVSYLSNFIHQPVTSVTYNFLTSSYNKRLTKSSQSQSYFAIDSLSVKPEGRWLQSVWGL